MGFRDIISYKATCLLLGQQGISVIVERRINGFSQISTAYLALRNPHISCESWLLTSHVTEPVPDSRDEQSKAF
jgi:hypothetical protein